MVAALPARRHSCRSSRQRLVYRVGRDVDDDAIVRGLNVPLLLYVSVRVDAMDIELLYTLSASASCEHRISQYVSTASFTIVLSHICSS